MANPSVRSRSTTIFDLIRKVDPEYQRDRQREVEYDYRERLFYANPAHRGPYAPVLDDGASNGPENALHLAGILITLNAQPITLATNVILLAGVAVTLNLQPITKAT